ncbi:hypothetical protein KKD52_18345 [Myxococcota bacterium]|nr:hypothetical protein [Myxococcota bacterium]MBU1512316.1 hypothetical protein [Myxococcota bacterium]
MRTTLPFFVLIVSVLLFARPAAAQNNLVVDNTTIQMGGIHHYDSITVINNGRITVIPFNGTDRVNTGNLQLVAPSIHIDATSSIIGTASGYQPLQCQDGTGPAAYPLSGGRGGCSVMDSGGGGAHFGGGGRGTRDCPGGVCTFPLHWEEDCGSFAGTSCTAAPPGCYNGDGLPTVAGQSFSHSIYAIEFGASGGDAGCLDSWNTVCMVAGPGGGRVVLAAVTPLGTGVMDIQGRVIADGRRGCGILNDSAGGGAGGSVLIVGDSVSIGETAVISAAGGIGGNTQPYPAGECPGCAQVGGTCDDCGGGGGGGIVSVLSGSPADIHQLAAFRVGGAAGGVCACAGEAGGGAGELQLSGVYVGEVCDGYDNDFDDIVDNNLPDRTCGTGACEVTVEACDGGVPNDCVPADDPLCQPPITDTRSRFMVIVDTSGSMLLDLTGAWTFGDGSPDHVGLNTNADGIAGNDSRLYKAKEALRNVISAYYPDIDFGLARYAQGSGPSVNCQLARSFECAGICCTYDDPTNNTGTPDACSVTAGAAGTIAVPPQSPTSDACINYAGGCGSVRRGADILVGFERPVNQLIMWIDNQETSFNESRIEGDFCDFAGGGDCELRGTGPTPLADSLLAVKGYMAASIADDRIDTCRRYAVILLTDGIETCRGNPVTAAAELLNDLAIETYVIGFSVLPSEQASLNQIAQAGSFGNSRNAFFVGNEDELAAVLAGIVADSVVYERCNDWDDDCDGLVDEDFPTLGQPCDDGAIGACRGTGVYNCRLDGAGTECIITTPGATPSDEVCNGLDDNCNDQVDEGLNCQSQCTPTGAEVCDGIDNDCNGLVDETDPLMGLPCGEDEGVCEPGSWQCAGGVMVCLGAVTPGTEMCNGLDDDCDGLTDNEAPCPAEYWCIEGGCRARCGEGEFPCGGGYVCRDYTVDSEDVRVCMPTACASCEPGEVCVDNACVDPCADVSCDTDETCVMGVCRDCHTLGCDAPLICYDGQCQDDPCADVTCPEASQYCSGGQCLDLCRDERCPEGSACDAAGQCAPVTCSPACAEGTVCVEGQCETDPCPLVFCEKGTICVYPGECIPDPCPLLDCPDGTVCDVLDDGSALCRYRNPLPDPEVFTVSGKVGCTCAAGGTVPGSGTGGFAFPGVLLLMGLFLARFRGVK